MANSDPEYSESKAAHEAFERARENTREKFGMDRLPPDWDTSNVPGPPTIHPETIDYPDGSQLILWDDLTPEQVEEFWENEVAKESLTVQAAWKYLKDKPFNDFAGYSIKQLDRRFLAARWLAKHYGGVSAVLKDSRWSPR